MESPFKYHCESKENKLTVVLDHPKEFQFEWEEVITDDEPLKSLLLERNKTR